MDELLESLNHFDTLLKMKGSIVEAIGDCPNVEIKVFPEPVFWKSVKQKSGWDCQVNVITGKARIISPDGIRKGNGSKNAMLEKMERLASGTFLKKGDIVGVSRNGLYEHYAVYLGNNRVIHYCGENNDFAGRVTIHEALFDEFIKNSNTFFVVWFDNGKPIKLQKDTTFLFNTAMDYYTSSFQSKKRNVFSAEETIERAQSRLGEEQYNLVTNNCEHFAMWCKTGNSESSQVKNIVKFAVASGVTGYGIAKQEDILFLQ